MFHSINNTKGIILAGGKGTRLSPLTNVISKQLLPVFDKPMIYYPLCTLMLAGIREIAIITTPEDQESFQKILKDGHQWGIEITYLVQEKPNGLPEAFVLAKDFIDGCNTVLILGDNIFYGSGLGVLLRNCLKKLQGASILTYWVEDPSRYGVVHFNDQNEPTKFVEKPKSSSSPWAVPGLYIVDHTAAEKAARLKPSHRGETEITELLNLYLQEGALSATKLNRGFAWFDSGTHESLLEASEFIATLQKRQGTLIASPEELSFYMEYIDLPKLQELTLSYPASSYKKRLERLIDEAKSTAQGFDQITQPLHRAVL